MVDWYTVLSILAVYCNVNMKNLYRKNENTKFRNENVYVLFLYMPECQKSGEKISILKSHKVKLAFIYINIKRQKFLLLSLYFFGKASMRIEVKCTDAGVVTASAAQYNNEATRPSGRAASPYRRREPKQIQRQEDEGRKWRDKCLV